MRIAIVALNALPSVEPSQGRRIGGLETFAWKLAKGVAKLPDDQVLFLVRSDRKRAQSPKFGIQVDFIFEPCREIRQSVSRSIEFNSSHRWPRVKSWQPSLCWKLPVLAIRKAFFRSYSEESAMEQSLSLYAPEMIVTLGVNETSARLGRIAKRLDVPIVLWLQSNADLEHRLYTDDSFVDRYGVRSNQARDCVEVCRNLICQTQTQMQSLVSLQNSGLLNRGGPLRSVHIPNPIDATEYRAKPAAFDERQGVLWVGRADRFHKRPLMALEIARKFPEIPFTLVVNPGEPEVHQEINGTKPANVTLIDYVPADQMQDRMQSARLFLSTGAAEYEGFPNVLLEAAASGTPTVSLEDFDSYLHRSGAGVSCNGSLVNAIEQIHRLQSNPSDWQTASDSARSYIQLHHATAGVVAKFRNWIAEL